METTSQVLDTFTFHHRFTFASEILKTKDVCHLKKIAVVTGGSCGLKKGMVQIDWIPEETAISWVATKDIGTSARIIFQNHNDFMENY